MVNSVFGPHVDQILVRHLDQRDGSDVELGLFDEVKKQVERALEQSQRNGARVRFERRQRLQHSEFLTL